jgi:hypothetical protein
VESHPPEVILEANQARSRLKRVYNQNRRPISDERQPKRAGNPYALFTKSRWASGDFSGVSLPDSVKQISSEWKALSDSQRQVSNTRL